MSSKSKAVTTFKNRKIGPAKEKLEGMKYFELSCVSSIEDLVQRYPDLTIAFKGERLNIKDIQASSTNHERLSTSENGSINGEINCLSDSSSIKGPRRIALIKKSRPLRRNMTVSKTVDYSTTTKSTNTRSAKTKPINTKTKTDSVYNDSKPGTIGSKQALTAPSRRNPTSRKTANSSRGVVTTQPIPERIDTNNMVDDSIVNFLPEIGQRAHLERLPAKPEELCLPFKIVIIDLDLRSSETPPHAYDDERLSTWKALLSPSSKI